MQSQVFLVILVYSLTMLGSCSHKALVAPGSPDGSSPDAGSDERVTDNWDLARGVADVPSQDAVIETSVDAARDTALARDTAVVRDTAYPDQPSKRPYQIQRLTAGTAESGFGGAVAISGDTLSVASASEGIVHFFDRTTSGWRESQAVSLPQLAAYHVGVEALAMDGDVTVAGSPDISRPGWVHVLRRTGGQWALEARLDDPAVDQEAMFGNSVGVSGDTIVVGAKGNATENPGTAYAFVKTASGWLQQAKFESLSSDAPASARMRDQFGWSVAISGDRVAVVRPFGILRGVDVYRRANGTWQKDFGFPPMVVSYEQPISVSVTPERLLLGDNADCLAYLYRDDSVSGWTQEHRLTAEPQFNLGYSVALDQKLAVLGGLSRGASGREGRGDVYVFVLTQGAWTGPLALVPPDDGLSSAGFGHQVAASGSTVVVGASRAMEFTKEYGAVYVFDLDI